MAGYVQIFSMVMAGILLLWFGYTLFFRLKRRGSGNTRGPGPGKTGGLPRPQGGYPGASRTCPVCSARLPEGERVSSAAFPSTNGGDRVMRIRGCVYCLAGERERLCPVCGASLNVGEFLVSRMLERPFRRTHIHVTGCSRCRRGGL